MLHISLITSPTNWYLYRWVSWNISEVINEISTSAFNYWDDFNTPLLDEGKRKYSVLLQSLCAEVMYGKLRKCYPLSVLLWEWLSFVKESGKEYWTAVSIAVDCWGGRQQFVIKYYNWYVFRAYIPFYEEPSDISKIFIKWRSRQIVISIDVICGRTGNE